MRLEVMRLRANALRSLGLRSVARVGVYRALLRAGYYRRRLPVRSAVDGPFLVPPSAGASRTWPATAGPSAWADDAGRVLRGELPTFAHEWSRTGFPPPWDRSVLAPDAGSAPDAHWTAVADFGLPGGDIKGYWEPARFDGLLTLALGWLATGDTAIAVGIERWISSFATSCPPNRGVQWKCGQETGIRLMHLVAVAEILESHGGWSTTDAFATLVRRHAERISPTMLYAVGQDNNHGTSEAAALYAAGAWLRRRDPRARRQAARWARRGRRWLHDRARRLIMDDGSFSQHSVTYHRMMLDAMCFAETMRRRSGDAPFADEFSRRCMAAAAWLEAITDPASGDAPNLGANDGARLFPLSRCGYRDFRPTVHWAERCFAGGRRLDELWADTAIWLLGDAPPDRSAGDGAHDDRRRPLLLADGGYVRLTSGADWALLRAPRYAFRPSHCDPLHLDLWIDGRNLLRDGGSYSYNTDRRWLDYFTGIESHNTVQFDDRQPMPRVSRFLFGHWLQTDELVVDPDANRVVARYHDDHGATHRRVVTFSSDRCDVVDTVAGFTDRAVLRWRLDGAPDGWQRAGAGWTDSGVDVVVGAECDLRRLELVEGWESRFYAERTSLAVVEAEVDRPTTLTTVFRWRR